MRRSLVIFAVGLALGVLLVRLFTPVSSNVSVVHSDGTVALVGAAPPGSPTTDESAAEAGPDDEDADVSARQLALLLEENEALRARLAQLELQGAAPDGTVGDATDVARQERAPPSRDSPHEGGTDRKPWFADHELLALGLSTADVDRIRLRWEQYVMDQLRVKAEINTNRKMASHLRRSALKELTEEVRADLGDESYDAMLYAAGTKNRVVMTDILETSPAAEAGVIPGDEVIWYWGERIYDPLTLRRLTMGGSQGEIARLVVLRHGQTISLYVPRGPLGVRLEHASRLPILR